MRLTRITILVLAFIALSAFADDAKHAKDVAECRKAAPVMQHPGDLKKAKQDAFNICMRGKGYAVGKIRAK